MPNIKYPLALINRAAELTGKTKDTVRRWAKQGLNLSDDEAVLAWTQTKGHNPNPARIKLKFEALSAKPKPEPKPEPEIIDIKLIDRLPPPGDEGAAAALKRLQGLE